MRTRSAKTQRRADLAWGLGVIGAVISVLWALLANPSVNPFQGPASDYLRAAPGTAPGTAPLAPATEAPGSAAQSVLDRCFRGGLAFRPPTPISQGDTVEFVVRVTPSSSAVDPSTNLPGSGPIERRQPIVCETMRADLTSTGLIINRSTNATGTIALPRDGVGEWGWHLTGNKPGKHEIVLRLLALDPDGLDITVETFRDTITVEVGYWYVVTSWVKEWAAPLSALVPVVTACAGLGYWLRKTRGKHVASEKSPTPTER
jgi:hypothetical protein